jgi:hypothetical protein
LDSSVKRFAIVDPQIRHRGETRTTMLGIICIMTMVLLPVLIPLAVHARSDGRRYRLKRPTYRL